MLRSYRFFPTFEKDAQDDQLLPVGSEGSLNGADVFVEACLLGDLGGFRKNDGCGGAGV